MSTQLILYPQNYEGVYSFTSQNEFVVDGINFTTIDSSTSYSTTGSLPAHLIATPPAIINTWYRWRNTSSSTPAFPVETSGSLVMDGDTPIGFSAVYQKLSNLTVGATYTLTVNMSAVNNLIALNVWNSTTTAQVAQIITSSNTTQVTLGFTAQTTNDIVSIIYYSTSTSNLTISDISITATVPAPPQTNADLSDGQVICDLYEEEDIPLTLSVDDFKSVAEKVQSYSKDFDLPATKRNNRIFNNMFDVTRADDGIIFNPYVRTKCVLKQDGFILFEGYLRLIDVKENEGEISYNVNLYSEVIALADVLKDSTFADLDFSELAHDYDKDSIKNSWSASVGLPLINTITSASFAYDSSLSSPTDHTSVLKYPFIDWNHQYLIGGTGSGNNATAGNPELVTLEQAFRPCIQLKYLINKIFAASGFNWTSTFFDSDDFEKLFMDFNWGEGNAPVTFATQGQSLITSATADNFAGTSYSNILMPEDWWGGTNPWNTNSGFDTATGVFTSVNDNTTYQINYEVQLYFTAATTVTIEWVSSTDGVINQTTHVGYTGVTWYYSAWVTTILNTGDTLFCRFKAVHASRVKQNNVAGGGGSYIGNVSADNISTGTLLQTLRGELGQWDFLKGIMTMFNLVSMVDETYPDNILIEPYADVFINNTNCSTTTQGLTLACRSIEHDWTEKVDASEMELTPLTDLNKNTIFQFVEDEDDYVFKQYKISTSGHLYGSKKIDASTSSAGLATVLEGIKEITAEPFAATVSKPLMSQFAEFIVPSIYAMSDDGTSEGFDNSPRILYNNGQKDTGVSYYIPAQNGKGSENQDDYLQFSHLSSIPVVISTPPAVTDTRDFVFESQQLFDPIAPSGTPTNNLFSTYWQPYFNELYNADTRTMILKVNLSPADIASFKFYDVVMIKNRAFRVNKIDYKPNDLATVEFILIP